MTAVESVVDVKGRESMANRGSLRWQSGARSIFRVVSFVECFTWVGMLTGMAFKYLINGNGIGVTIFGWAHGITWLCYLAAALFAAVTFRWKVWVLLIGWVSSTLPFLTWPFERWMLKTGRIDVDGSHEPG
ncbi:DUF3817 domain-containing protein [Glutamicibacter sp. MNS18]|uniref:DUF3817 domain-containing protein n=1 Tax=Glutamicibacter sp. MNS18 TaxID=2989817 RepID=UPI002236B14A|nr:DUF3817 domain-containing protein [Glutamicibacter sp. MNS18]MCW4466815.1 DUF3817 domain-containing protein [Glutamicibacter sp. MNS18]